MTRGQAQNTCSCVPAHLVSGNVGADKDSDKRQRATIQAFARRGGYELVAEHYDATVSGADPIEGREGFAALLDRIENDGAGIAVLAKGGVQLLTASSDDLIDSEDLGRKMMRQVAARSRNTRRAVWSQSCAAAATQAP
jgi:hypothetical protein